MVDLHECEMLNMSTFIQVNKEWVHFLLLQLQHNRIANRTGFSVYVVLVLNVIRYSCHYFLDKILFHHDFHHDSCDYHWDFYGH